MNSNTLDFFVRMRDMFSSPLAKLAQNSHKTFAGMNSDVSTLTSGYQKLDAIMNKVAASYKRSSAMNSFSSANRLIGMAGIGLGAGAAVGFAKSSVMSAMNYGATSKSFEVLTGDAAKGKGLANDLNKLQQSTILGPEVFKSAQTLMSFGVAGEKVIKIEKMLGDVSMGNKDKFESLTLAFSQTQSAGRLMGQDLLQYVNAGFNPLKEISDMTGVSMSILKKRMEDGSISADMVTKAFEHATSEGGKFNNMMETIGETTYGKMQILEGQFENFKIQVGNSLMPVAEELMGMGNNLLSVLNLTESETSKLIGERSGMNALVDTIVSMNSENTIRQSLLSDLIKTYPEFFGNLNSEKASNIDLLKTLEDVNDAYRNKIKLAANSEVTSGFEKQYTDAASTNTQYLKIAEMLRSGYKDQAHELMPFNDGNGILGLFKRNDPAYWEELAKPSFKAMQEAKEKIDEQHSIKENITNQGLIDKVMAMYNNDSYKSIIKNPQDQHEFESAAKYFGLSGGLAQNVHEGNPHWYVDYEKLNKIITPSMAAGGDNKDDKNVLKNLNTVDSVAKGVTNGGPRTININGVKFTDKIEIHVDSLQDGIDKTESKLFEMFLRTLNSGASVQ